MEEPISFVISIKVAKYENRKFGFGCLPPNPMLCDRGEKVDPEIDGT